MAVRGASSVYRGVKWTDTRLSSDSFRGEQLRALAVSLSSVLFLIAVLHLYWAVRGVGTGAGVPSRADGTPAMRPGRLAALAVAVALVTAGILLLGHASVIRTGLSTAVLRAGSWGVAATFAARTIGEFRYVGLFRRVRGTPFAKWDALVFTPLCFVLGVGAAVIAAT